MSEMNGYVLAYEDNGMSSVIDGVVGRNEGKYHFLTAEKHRGQDHGVNVVTDYHFEAESVRGDGEWADIRVLESDYGDEELHCTIHIPGMRKNCLGRLHYITDEEANNLLYVRIKVDEVRNNEDETDFNLTMMRMMGLGSAEDVTLPKEEVEAMLTELELDVIIEALKMRKTIRDIG